MSERIPRRRREADNDAAPAKSRSASRPPPPASIVVIGCRILGAIALIVALAMGRWAQVVEPNVDPSAGPGWRKTFGLTEASLYIGDGNALRVSANIPYSDSADDHDSMQDPARTSTNLGRAIGALLLAAGLLTLGSLGELFGKPRLSALASFGLLASIGTTLLGWIFLGAGLVSASPVKATGGSSFYTSILAVLILAIAWTRSRVGAMDASRRAHLPPPPKRRRRGQSRTGPS